MAPRTTATETAAKPEARKRTVAAAPKTGTARKRKTPVGEEAAAAATAVGHAEPAAAVQGPGTGSDPAAKPAVTAYRARAACRVGVFREPGETFSWRTFETCPAYLEEIDEAELVPGTGAPRPVSATRPAMPAQTPGPTREEILGRR